MAADQLVLGLDLGTTSVKGVLINLGDDRIVEDFSVPTNAQWPSYVDKGVEQNVSSIVSALERLMMKFSKDHLKKVVCLGVSGQMHGIVLWKDGLSTLQNERINVDTESTSALVTWQDGRCDDTFLSSLPLAQHSTPIQTGYGCATLFWYTKHGYDISAKFNRAGTIMDYLVYILCGNCGKVVMSSQNANSWGYFNVIKLEWEYEILKDNGFPVSLLPQVDIAPSLAGKLIEGWCGLPSGVLVSVAMGDLQCSVSAVAPKETDAIINIGSAIQLSVMINSDLPVQVSSTLSNVPYFYDQTLLVAAALTGADIIAKMVGLFKEFLKGIGVSDCIVNDEMIYSYLIQSANERLNTTLQVRPLLYGERHCPTDRGSVTNINADNCSIGDISCAVMKGIVTNIKHMMPADVLQQFKIKKIIGCGSTCHKNPVLTKLLEEEFDLPVVLNPFADAPLGAAIMMSHKLKHSLE